MAFEVLFVFLAMLMVTETERARHLPTRRRLCLCADRVLPLRSFSDGKESSFVSCKEWCSTKDFEGKMSSHLRIRRNDVEGFTECPPGLDHIDKKWHIKKENIRVHFHDIKGSSRWLVQVSWSPFIGSTKGWDKYYMRYFTGEGRSPYQNFSCLTPPKNRTSVNITSSNKKRKITLIVTALPNIRSGTKPNLVLEPFTPTKQYGPPVYTPGAVLITSKPTSEHPPARPLPTFPPTSSNDTIKIAVAASGAVFGLVLLAAFLFFIYRRRIRPCSLLYEGDRRQEGYFMRPNNLVTIPAPGRPTPVALSTAPNAGPDSFYACYFPENEWFKLQVASVVNFFRNNGYPVEMDVMNSCELSSGPTRWAEQQIRRARNVLIFLSPGLLRLSGVDEDDPETHQEHERVWYELALLKKIFLQTHSASKMVCIALPNTNIKPQELPLWAELIYKWPEDEQKIFKRLNDKPIIQPWKC